jgi:hypothetical protein
MSDTDYKDTLRYKLFEYRNAPSGDAEARCQEIERFLEVKDSAMQKRITLLEAVAEAAVRQHFCLMDYTKKALKAAGYLQERSNEDSHQ